MEEAGPLAEPVDWGLPAGRVGPRAKVDLEEAPVVAELVEPAGLLDPAAPADPVEQVEQADRAARGDRADPPDRVDPVGLEGRTAPARITRRSTSPKGAVPVARMVEFVVPTSTARTSRRS